MYKEIENILVRTLSPYEYEQLETLKKDYAEQEIIKTYKNSAVKNINYIKKILQSKIKKTNDWLDKPIINKPIDDETKETYEDFKKFMEEFRK